MDTITVKEAGDKWGITGRMVAHYCHTGRIEGAFKQGNAWLIPANAPKPPDSRLPAALGQESSSDEYLRRIHRVQDYVEAHLYDALTLEELASVAGFSKFHFHRIFKGLAHESLWQYVSRIKLERAAISLVHRPNLTVTDAAYHYGFTDSATFSRAFKHHFGLSPVVYRNQQRKNRNAPDKISSYNEGLSTLQDGSITMNVCGDVEILTIEEIRVVYVRYTGTYQELGAAYPGLLEKLLSLANAQNLIHPGQTNLLAIYHDNHEITKEHQLRTSLCLTIPNTALVKETGDIGSMQIPAGKYAVGHFEIFQNEYSAAWDFMYGEWLSNSSYQPLDSFPFELYRNNASEHPQGKHLVDIYVPIEPLGKL
jgi:AraC family transcriptional regulator